MAATQPMDGRWYHGITRYQWIVLIIASLGWIFDVFEGQIFVASGEAMKDLAPQGTPDGVIRAYRDYANGAFLLGGSLGGIFFGMLSDRWGRTRTMSLTILFYSIFTCFSAFAGEWWHLVVLRFFVAMGVGGEWAVASSLVAEVFPNRARPYVGSIFHASSAFGSYLAVAAGYFLMGNPEVHAWIQSPEQAWLADYVELKTAPWRIGFLMGLLPALLILWVRWSVKEPEAWKAARDEARVAGRDAAMGRLSDLFQGPWMRPTILSVLLAATGLATFWLIYVNGKNLLQRSVERSIIAEYVRDQPEKTEHGIQLEESVRTRVLKEHAPRIKRWEMLGMFLVTTGGGIGMFTFGPLSIRWGRLKTFALYYLGGFVCGLAGFQLLFHSGEPWTMILFLPLFGFLTGGMHAGYAVYFPELYPTRIRSTGTGFCFNAGRLIATPILFLVGWIQGVYPGFDQSMAASAVSLLYLLGACLLLGLPETRGKDLP